MVNLLEALYVVSAVCLAVTLYHAWRVARTDVDRAGRHRRLLKGWGAATLVLVLVCAALYAYLG